MKKKDRQEKGGDSGVKGIKAKPLSEGPFGSKMSSVLKGMKRQALANLATEGAVLSTDMERDGKLMAGGVVHDAEPVSDSDIGTGLEDETVSFGAEFCPNETPCVPENFGGLFANSSYTIEEVLERYGRCVDSVGCQTPARFLEDNPRTGMSGEEYQEFMAEHGPDSVSAHGLVVRVTLEDDGKRFVVSDVLKGEIVAEKVSSDDHVEFVVDQGSKKISIDVVGMCGSFVSTRMRVENISGDS